MTSDLACILMQDSCLIYPGSSLPSWENIRDISFCSCSIILTKKFLLCGGKGLLLIHSFFKLQNTGITIRVYIYRLVIFLSSRRTPLCRFRAGCAWGPLLGLGSGRWSWSMQDLCCRVRELWGAITRVHGIRDDEKEINKSFSETPQVQEPEFPTALDEGGKGRVFAYPVWKWRLPGWLKLVATSGTRGKTPVPPEDLPLWDRLRAPVANKELGSLSKEDIQFSWASAIAPRVSDNCEEHTLLRWRTPSCQRLQFRRVQRGSWTLFKLQVINPYYYSMRSPAMLPGDTWSVLSMTVEL